MKFALLAAVLVGLGVLFFILFRSAAPTDITNYPGNGNTIVAFGDSLVAGVGDSEGGGFVGDLEASLGVSIVNRGVSGDTTADGLARLNEVIAENPNVVIVLFGGNDFLQQVPPEETFANLDEMITRLHQAGSMVVLLGVRGGLLRDEYADQYQALAKKHDTAYVSDVLGGLITDRSLMADRVHPNDAGYEVIAKRVEPVLRPLLE